MHSDYRVYDLWEQERKLKHRSLTIASYIAKLKAIWRELDLLWPTGDKQSPSCIREVKFRTIKFLMGLNPEYENLKSQLLHRERFPTLSEAVSELQGAESRKKLNTTGETRSTPTAAVHWTKKEEPGETRLQHLHLKLLRQRKVTLQYLLCVPIADNQATSRRNVESWLGKKSRSEKERGSREIKLIAVGQ